MDERDRESPRPREVDVPGLSPVRAFLAVCILATLVGGLFFATRDAAPSEPATVASPVRSPDFSLTDAEAIAEFERLRRAALTAIRNRDVSLAEEVFTSDGPLYERASAEIEMLLSKKVIDRSTFTSLSTSVLRRTATEFSIIERSRLEPCFESVSGRDVSTGPAAVRQLAEWTLRVENGRWLLHDAKILRDAAIGQREARCD